MVIKMGGERLNVVFMQGLNSITDKGIAYELGKLSVICLKREVF